MIFQYAKILKIINYQVYIYFIFIIVKFHIITDANEIGRQTRLKTLELDYLIKV